jgi:hypothetical protein
MRTDDAGPEFRQPGLRDLRNSVRCNGAQRRRTSKGRCSIRIRTPASCYQKQASRPYRDRTRFAVISQSFRTGFRTLRQPTLSIHASEPDERVDRIRRIQENDLENLPFFFIAGALYALTNPPLWAAQWLLYGYAVSRLATSRHTSRVRSTTCAQHSGPSVRSSSFSRPALASPTASANSSRGGNMHVEQWRRSAQPKTCNEAVDGPR